MLFLAALVVGGYLVALRHSSAATKDIPAAPRSQREIVCLGLVDLPGGVVALTATSPTRVVEVLVNENEQVSAKTVLLATDDRLAREAKREAESAVRAATEQLANVRRTVQRHDLQRKKQEAAVAAADARLVAAQLTVDLKRSLRSLRQVSEKEVAIAEELVAECRAAVKGENASLEELALIDPQHAVVQAEADLERAEARLAQADAALAVYPICAPADGKVLRLLARQGETVSPALPAVLFAPDGPRVVRAELEQTQVDAVAVGAVATIEDDTDRSRTWEGKVMHIADWFAKRRTVIDEAPTFNDTPTVECIVAIEGDGPPPRVGQRVRVHIAPNASRR